MRTKTYRIQDIYPTLKAEHDSVEADITADLAKLKFFCGQANSKEKCCFSHIIGLPNHPCNKRADEIYASSTGPDKTINGKKTGKIPCQ